MKRAVITIVVVAVAGLGAAEDQPVVVRFPGAQARALDPSGRYAVECGAADEAARGACQGLLLRELVTGKTRPLRALGLWATVLWAPSGRRVAVTDGVRSDSSEVWVYRADEPSVPVAAWEVLERQKKGGLTFAAGADHRYLEAVAWLDERTLVVRAWGYGGPKPFDRRLNVKLPE